MGIVQTVVDSVSYPEKSNRYFGESFDGKTSNHTPSLTKKMLTKAQAEL